MKSFELVSDIPGYKESILNYTTYESEPGDIQTNSHRHAANELTLVGATGREYAQRNYTDYGFHSIWYSAAIATLRFSDGSEVEYIGRDVFTKNLLSEGEAFEIAYWTNAAKGAHVFTKFEDGRSIESWQTETGKRSGNGMFEDKQTKPKTYKRNRRGIH